MPSLFVIPAKEAPVAVIFRRSGRWYHVIQWETQLDVFTPGAWFKGRIYEHKCDISPDGKLLLCFVLQGSRRGTDFTHAWTAVSRVPWMHALTLWPQGTTYGGGGRFVDDRTVALRGVLSPAHKDFPLGRLRVSKTDDPPEQARTSEDWVGRDHNGSVVFSRGGKLFRRVRAADWLIADFTTMTPQPQEAPEWARQRL